MRSTRRMSAWFSGHVQGVGFRFTAVALARRFPSVTGYVRNLRDGRVELVAEGPDSELAEFLRQVQEEMSGYIREVKVHYAEPTGEFSGFGVRY